MGSSRVAETRLLAAEARRGAESGVTLVFFSEAPAQVHHRPRPASGGSGGRSAAGARPTGRRWAGEEGHDVWRAAQGCGLGDPPLSLSGGPRARPAAFTPSPPPAAARTRPWRTGPGSPASWDVGCAVPSPHPAGLPSRAYPVETRQRGLREMASGLQPSERLRARAF